jgi:hypothetical protein
MKGSNYQRRPLRAAMLGLVLLAVVGLTGCQVDVGGQTMPSPYYFGDDIQYFQAGPEFKLSQEAAALREYSEEQALQGR